MNITELKDKINALNLLDQFPDIHGYELTFKEVQGVTTNDLCVQFHVEKKKSLEQLTPEQILPTTLSSLGVDIITDVRQDSINYHLGSKLTDINDDNSNIELQYQSYLQQKAYNEQNKNYDITSFNKLDFSTYFNDPDNQTIDPIRLNYLKNRPLLGGSSSIYIGGTDATLGLIVRDSLDDSVVALSNNHVYAASQFVGSNALSGDFLNTTALSGRQPGTSGYGPYGSSTPAQDCIGIHKRCVSFDQTKSNKTDCAILALTSYSLISPLSTQVTGFKNIGPYKFATTQEIDSLIDPLSINFNAPIFRNGRTLGPIGNPGNLYSKLHTTAVSAVDITPFSIQNIKSVRFTDTHGTGQRSTSFYGNIGLIIETINGDIYKSGFMEFIPNLPSRTLTLEKIGNFTYFNKTDTATYGISANKLVYYADLLSWGNGFSVNRYSNSPYVSAPAQLPSYQGVTNIILSYYGSFILSGDSLYTIGSNSKFQTLGFGSSSTVCTTWTKIPGNWKSIQQINNYDFLALSASGDVFYTGAGRIKEVGGGPALLGQQFTNSWDLTANNLYQLGKLKKLFINNDWYFENFALSANGGKLINFKMDSIAGNNLIINQIDGVWGDDVKILCEGTNAPMPFSRLMLSGTKIYQWGRSLKDYYKIRSSLFNGATSRTSYTTFTEVTGLNVNYMEGWSDYLYGNSESLIYLSGGTWYCVGDNSDGIFSLNYQTLDDIIVNGIGVNANVSGYLPAGGATTFTDCLTIKSKHSNFPIIQGGDSGTAVFALLSSTIPALSTWKCIGLAFAGPAPTNTAAGIVCRIDNIVDQLKIKPWDGTIPTTQSKISNITYASTLTAIPTITLSGREYYNIGLL